MAVLLPVPRAVRPTAIHALFAGFVLGYVIYDTVHWYTHAGAPTGALLKFLRREHLVHHFSESGTPLRRELPVVGRGLPHHRAR